MRPILTILRSGHWPSLLGAWLHFEVSFMVWLLVGAMGVSMAEEFGLSAAQQGVLLAMPMCTGALLRIPVGFWSDRLGAKWTGLLILAAEAMGLSWGWAGAQSYWELLTIAALLGVAGASFAVALPIAGRAYPPAHQGTALGVAASANSGIVLAMWVAPRIAAGDGWHDAMGWMLVPVGGTMVLFSALVRRDVWTSCEWVPSWRERVGDLRRDRSLPWLCVMYAVTFGGFVGLSSALPMFLHHQYGIGVVAAGSVAALCGLTGSLLRPVGGFVADRCGGLRVLPLVLAILAVFVSIIGALPSPAVAMGCLWGAIGLMGFGNGVVFEIVADRFPKRIGMASGIIGAAGAGGGVCVPLWLGGLKDLTGSFSPGLWLYAASSCLAALVVARIGLARSEPAEIR